MDNQHLWHSVINSLERKFSKTNLITWFQDVDIKQQKDNQVTIAVPNIFVKEWLHNKFEKDLLKTFQNFSPDIQNIKYVISKSSGHLDLRRSKNNKAQTLIDDISQPQIEFYQNRISGLNPKYTFQNFIVGQFNQLAHACALSILKKAGSINPLFVYSGVGLGKTHILEAIGNETINERKKKKVKYIPCPNFTSQIINAIRNQGIEKVVDVYSNFDVLIVDDIEFLAGKERTQEVFFRVFNNIKENDKQIILSSDRPPHSIENLEERLRSRFEGGMIADISFPDYEERLAILEEKIEERGGILPQEILEFIAKNIKKNIRELEGALTKALIIFEQERSFEKVKNALENIILEPRKKLSADKIIQTVCDFYNISQREILSKTRKKEVVLPRQTIMYLLREEINLSLPSIGVKIGNKDHTTVGYACEKIEDKIKKDGEFIKDIEVLKERIYST
ncbi:MAG: chromosomal replication initiator protein DnaA [Candidatus Pacebacteria bacterium]|nr:chromosomal replication initiator protein DnaA [Candidatus Paceibacterota bacterium]